VDEEQEEKSFTVSDKRFSARREPAPERPREAPRAPSPPTEQRSPEQPHGVGPEMAEPEVNLASLLILLGNQAIMHLGGVPNPVTQQRETDIPAAKHMIDLLGTLEVKTKGNLTDDEEQLLRQLLLELRLQYVRATGR
jgi:hypothetical protein